MARGRTTDSHHHPIDEQVLPPTPRHNGGDDLFREVNDRIMELGMPFGVEQVPLELICECENRTCTARVEITAAEFARLRRVDGLHLVAAGHVHLGRVVDRGDGYVVVADD